MVVTGEVLNGTAVGTFTCIRRRNLTYCTLSKRYPLITGDFYFCNTIVVCAELFWKQAELIDYLPFRIQVLESLGTRQKWSRRII